MLNPIKNTYKYGPAPSSHDLLKFVALWLMVIDHLYYLFPDMLLFKAIGRWCVPAWLFLAGYATPGRFSKELLFFGVLLVAVDFLVHRPIFPLNILFSILIARLYVSFAAATIKRPGDIWAHMLLLAALTPLTYSWWEYGAPGMLLALAGYHARNTIGVRNRLPVFAAVIGWFIAVQWINYDFSLLQQTVMITGVVMMGWWLLHFQTRFYEPLADRWYATFINLCARNTLTLYVLHLVLLLIARHMLYPETPGLKWF